MRAEAERVARELSGVAAVREEPEEEAAAPAEVRAPEAEAAAGA